MSVLNGIRPASSVRFKFYFSPSVRFFLLSWLFSATTTIENFFACYCSKFSFLMNEAYLGNSKLNSGYYSRAGSSILLCGTVLDGRII